MFAFLYKDTWRKLSSTDTCGGHLLVAQHCGRTNEVDGSPQPQGACVFPFRQAGCLRFRLHHAMRVERQYDVVAERVMSASRPLGFKAWLYALPAVGPQAGHLSSLHLRFPMCKMRVIAIICKNGGRDNKEHLHPKVVMRVNGFIYAKCFEQSLVCSQHRYVGIP